jgi:rubrerythrin
MWPMSDLITPKRARELYYRWTNYGRGNWQEKRDNAVRLAATVIWQAEEIERLRALSVDSPSTWPSNWRCPACGTLHIQAPASFKCSCGTHRGGR